MPPKEQDKEREKNINLAKENIQDFLKKQELLFFGQENIRTEKIQFPFYDGGLTPVVLYYVQKYKMAMKINDSLKNIKGDTLYQITSNFYKDYINNVDLKKNEGFDLFDIFIYSDNYLKKYYFYKQFYDFEIAVANFREIYEKTRKNVNFDGKFDWYSLVPSILLGLIAVRENPSIGLKDPQKLPILYNFIKITTEEYLNTILEKKNLNYLVIFWLYQMFDPNSSLIQKIGNDLVLQLIKLKKSNANEMWKIDDDEFRNYFANWIIYGIIKDYLNTPTNNKLFYNTYTLNDLSKGVIYEGFTNGDGYEDGDGDDEGGDGDDEGGDEDGDKNIGKKKSKSIKESFNNTDVSLIEGPVKSSEETYRPKFKKRDKVIPVEKPLWKLIIYCIIFGIFLYIAFKGLIFFWFHIIIFSKNNFYKYFNRT